MNNLDEIFIILIAMQKSFPQFLQKNYILYLTCHVIQIDIHSRSKIHSLSIKYWQGFVGAG